MRHILICGLPHYSILPHYLINRNIFERKVIEHKMSFWFFLSETFLIRRRNEWDMNKKVYCSSCKVLIILVRYQWNLNFPEKFSKYNQISNFMKIRPVGAELFHTDGRTYGDWQADMRKLIVAFRNFVNSPIIYHCSCVSNSVIQ